MEAGPTLETRVRTPLAVASTRLRGLLRNPYAWRVLVIGGLAVAGWLIGAGSAAAAVTPSAGGNPVSDRLGQAGEPVHADAARHAAGVLHRLRATPDDGTAAEGPVRQRPVRQKPDVAGGLVRATAPLHHGPIARAAHDRVGHVGHVDHIAGTDTPVRHAAGLIDGAGAAPRRSASAGTHETTHDVAGRVTSLLSDRTQETGAPLPVGGALSDPSSLAGWVARDVPSSCAPTLAAALRDGGVRACGSADASSSGTPAAEQRERLTGGPGTDARPALGRPSRPRPACGQYAAHCGHDTRPESPALPAPAGPGSSAYGIVPPASGPILSGTGDSAWAHFDHPPHHTAAVPARRGVLPPVVRTAADEPALSPD